MKPKVFVISICAALLCSSCAQNQTVSTAAGLPACVAAVTRDSNGNITDVVPGPNCVRSDVPRRNPEFVIGHGNAREPLKEVGSYITFGGGTTTCYGPPIPSPAMCVCTSPPCP